MKSAVLTAAELLFAAAILPPLALVSSFTIPKQPFTKLASPSSSRSRYTIVSPVPTVRLQMTTLPEGNDSSSSSSDEGPARKRRKRKDGKNVPSTVQVETEISSKEDAPPAAATTEKEEEGEKMASSSSTPPAAPVQMKVLDVRDIVSGVTPDQQDEDDDDEEEEEDDEDDGEYEYYYEDEDGREITIPSSSSPSSTSDDPMERLLADARKMREQSSSSVENESEGPSIPSTVRNVISSIVTADFFVVCGLLLWFLAGIFCSYVIKDDTVQIAFNGIFQPVVQPALGILMIGSALGAVFEKPSEE